MGSWSDSCAVQDCLEKSHTTTQISVPIRRQSIPGSAADLWGTAGVLVVSAAFVLLRDAAVVATLLSGIEGAGVLVVSTALVVLRDAAAVAALLSGIEGAGVLVVTAALVVLPDAAPVAVFHPRSAVGLRQRQTGQQDKERQHLESLCCLLSPILQSQ